MNASRRIGIFLVPLVISTGVLAHEPDETRLPVGDDRLVDKPTTGSIMECHTDPEAGGAQVEGPTGSTATAPGT